ncbi:MAG: trypsin-like peptidase domain-containing protein, partial [Planctomycetes bacterium]|nr:trypsin-like peptidase domain-containing protein [Planctomycetota bacterium]
MRRNQNLKIAFCVFLSILVVALGPVYGGRSNGSISETFQKVAKAGSAATVGIYFSQSEFVSYYGTGVVISPDGYILTSTTVIPPEAEKTILIYFADHSRREATLVESATRVEASLLKVDADGLPYVPLAETLPELGERAYTFGNARHMLRRSAQASFSAGRITGIYDVGSASGLSSYEGLAIETDAAINPGQDGGPLLDSEGKLAGIVSLSFSDARWLGVAVPTFKIKKALNSLTDGSVKTSETPLVTPPADDVAAGEDFLEAARNIVPALVKLDIKRKHPPEEMPRYHWPRFIAEHQDKWNNASKAEKAQLANVFFHAEKILRANQQVRRPDAPVSGVLISSDGYILTSAFNVAVDLAFVHKKKGIQPISFDEWSLSKLIGNPRNYRKQRNPVEKITAILSDGRTLPAKVISHHKPLRIALLKVEADDLPHLDLNTETDAMALGRQAAV